MANVGAYSKNLETITVPAGADLSSNQYKFHKWSSGQAVICATLGENAIGVLQNKPSAAARSAVFAVGGVTEIVLGGSVSQGDPITTDASGAGVVATDPDESVYGRALSDGASGSRIPVLLTFEGKASEFSIDGSALAAAKMWVGNASGEAAAVTISGDVAVSNAGVTTVTDLTIASEARGDLLRRGASAWERVAAKTSGQLVMGDGTDVVSQAMSGDATINGSGVVAIGSEKVEPSMLDNSAYCVVMEDFCGPVVIADQGSPGDSPWVTKDTSAAGAPTKVIVADGADGQLNLKFAANDESEILTLYWNDELNIDIDKGPVIIWRLKVDATPNANDTIVWGLAGAQNDTPDSVAQHAWWRLPGAVLTPVLESDDGTNDNDDAAVTTGSLTMVAGTFYEFKLDLASSADVKFYQRSTLAAAWTEQLVSGTTFDMSNYTGNLQPFFQLQKSGGTHQTGVQIDYVKVYWARS